MNAKDLALGIAAVLVGLALVPLLKGFAGTKAAVTL